MIGLVIVPFVIAIGQILFKVTSLSLTTNENLIATLLRTPTFWIAIIIYGAATVAWIPIIKDVPISQAYLFISLTFLYVPTLASVFLGEPFSMRTLVGSAVVVVGILISVSH